ncbi:MAG: rRNA maturation RNase YbeY [Tannerella sp.]|jgi:rRNA maturation RNase YbeY|nr:rRNA maturation RNase YbeY [Tannerella sp.]
MILYNTENIKMPRFPKRIVSLWIKNVSELHGKRVGDISYIFCPDSKILEINRQYLAHDYFTDIITFDDSEGDIITGDIFISVDTVMSNASAYSVSFAEELHRVMIHGVLHLCGIGDKTDCEREIMRNCENEALNLLNKMIQ